MEKKFKLSKRTKVLGAATLLSAGAVLVNIIRDQQRIIDVQLTAEMNETATICTLGEKLQSFMGKDAFMDFVKESCCRDGYSIKIDIPVLGE